LLPEAESLDGLDPYWFHQLRKMGPRNDAGMVVLDGRPVFQWGATTRRFGIKSSTKSVGATLLGLAIAKGLVGLDEQLTDCVPATLAVDDQNVPVTVPPVSIRSLATHTSGLDKAGGYSPQIHPPGMVWRYSDAGPNWIADCLTLRFDRDLRDVLVEEVLGVIGIPENQFAWRENAYRPPFIDGIERREFGSGISASVEALSRIGHLYLRDGRWRGKRLLPEGFVELVSSSLTGSQILPVEGPGMEAIASEAYGLLWWNNSRGWLPGVPHDAFWSWGLHDSVILVIPSMDLVVARAGGDLEPLETPTPKRMARFIQFAVAAFGRSDRRPCIAPYPASRVIAVAHWAPTDSLLRMAEGGDNWPATWMDDDSLFTAYGDGFGFPPKLRKKLSLGFATITGVPPVLRGLNVRSPSGEQTGSGPRGKKASGLVMVNGTLYMWVRNASNSQLAWSNDRGKTWHWSGWKFSESVGVPTFLNYGANYEGARDSFVYTYSPDIDIAYLPANELLLARVPKNAVTRRSAYEFFAGLDDKGAPRWTKELEQRSGVFVAPDLVYRTGISFNAGLGRYLLVMPLPTQDPRYAGGIGIYDAPEPWGPWTTVYFDCQWDIGPGESASFPTKWMSPDGLIAHMLFSGNDSLSVRRLHFRKLAN
jgi:CubicO group peptidase (beta-lactamase class C family)